MVILNHKWVQVLENKEITEKGEVDNRNIKINKYQKDAKMFADGVTGNSNEMYQYGISSLITDRARVYKGGSWKDRAYWLTPGSRRFLDETQSTDAFIDSDVQWIDLDHKHLRARIIKEKS